MTYLRPRCAVAPTEHRRHFIERRIAGLRTSPRLSVLKPVDLPSDLPSAPDSWQGLGGVAGSIVADLARRTGRVIL